MVVKRSNAENLDNYMIIDHSENIGISLICQFTPVEMVYYDDYAFHDSLSTAERQKYLKQDIIGADEIGPLLIGQPTGGKRALSDGSDKMLLYVNYYDRLGRVVQTCEDNILGKVDYNGTTYSLTDMPVTTEKFFNHSSSSLSHLVYTNTYDADGRKLRVSHYGSRGEKRDELDYIGDMVLRNGALERTLTPNGYIVNDTVYYYVKDYQGNVRSVVREDGAVVESNEYYPYGGLFSATPSVQPYKYGAKEFDRTHGLDWYDSKARFYDSILLRTNSVDKKAGDYTWLSPYLWCGGNPIKFVDPDGRKVELYATSLPGSDIPIATHTFIVIRDKQNNVIEYFAYGSEFNGIKGSYSGRLKQTIYHQDKMVYSGKDSEHLKKIIEITPPSGMSESEFDNVVTDVAKSFGNNKEISYFLIPSTGDMTEGNCNTSTSTILLKSGISQKRLNDIAKEIPGLSYGFSVNARPWTEMEQKEAVKQQRQANFLYNIVSKP